LVEVLFVAAYAGFSLGQRGSHARSCVKGQDKFCSSSTFAAGLGAEYSLAPNATYNPWLGYGIGYELALLGVNDYAAGRGEHVVSEGFTHARIRAGLDVRKKKAGFGPFVEVAMGKFLTATTDLDERGDYVSRIHDSAVHAWVTLGMRVVLNP
jgi:hypothetical protein